MSSAAFWSPAQQRLSATSLTPCQQPTSRKFRVAADVRIAQMLKHPTPCVFHSLAEYLHAALLEGDPTVSRFVPQPFTLRIGKKRYVPDCYLVRNGQEEVVELGPENKMGETRKAALEAFFQIHRMRFVITTNQSVVTRRQEATNWLRIIQILVCHRDLDTSRQEFELIDRLLRQGSVRFGTWLSPLDPSSTRPTEIALLRLLHQGKITADLTTDRFGYDTELRPWA